MRGNTLHLLPRGYPLVIIHPAKKPIVTDRQDKESLARLGVDPQRLEPWLLRESDESGIFLERLVDVAGLLRHNGNYGRDEHTVFS